MGKFVLGDRAVALIIERTVAYASISPEDFSRHSLRAGLATLGRRTGQHKRDIMQQTRHKRVKILISARGLFFKELFLTLWVLRFISTKKAGVIPDLVDS